MAAPVPAPITAPIAAPRRLPPTHPTIAPPTPPRIAPPRVFCATAWCDGIARTDATKAAIAKFRIIDVILPVAITLTCLHPGCGRSMATGDYLAADANRVRGYCCATT